MILGVSGINKAYDGTNILRDVSFGIEKGEKAAIVGVNGAGKTTLLRIILGIEDPDSGSVMRTKEASVGYLAQHQEISSEKTVYEELLSTRSSLLSLSDSIRASEKRMSDLEGDELEAEMRRYSSLTEEFERSGGYAYKSEVIGVLKGLGFEEEDHSKLISTLSGGQKTRVAMGSLLLTSPDIIILDEPTNHLDVRSVEWLEGYLRNYRGTVLLVSHDRYFLNRLVGKVIEIENSRATVFSGNYDDYSKKKDALRKAEYAAYIKQQQEKKHQEEVIAKLRSFNREKSIKRAESREKMLARTEWLDKPKGPSDSIKLSFTPKNTSGKDVLKIRDLSMSFDDLLLFEGLDLDIKRGEHICLIGANGTGKSTLLKIISGNLKPVSGTMTIGHGVVTAYYDQEMQLLDDSKTIYEEISDAYPSMKESEIRGKLAAFLFTGDKVFTRISALSGGERARVSLLKMMLSEANFIIMDEPTNHLDINSREVLESAVNAYEGTVLSVSHDRYFVNRISHRILDLSGKKIVSYLGDYDYYLMKKAELDPADPDSGAAPSASDTQVSASKEAWLLKKDEEAKKRKRASDIKKYEKLIEQYEAEIADVDAAFEDPETVADHIALTQLSQRRAELEKLLEEAYEKWTGLA